MKQTILSLLTFFFFASLSLHICANQIKKHRVYIIVHGTWAADALWYTPYGQFFKVISTEICPNDRVVPFRWSGSISHQGRIDASLHFAHLLSSYPEDTEIVVIAHSHGGNVAMAATQELARQNIFSSKIHVLYLLGTPISDAYRPDMNYVDYIYNLFSFDDLVQPVLGMFQRVFPKHPRICNLNITVNGKGPGHADLYMDTIARWIVYLHEHLVSFVCEKTLFSLPGTISFFEEVAPTYEIDEERGKKLDFDMRLQYALTVIPTYSYF